MRGQVIRHTPAAAEANHPDLPIGAWQLLQDLDGGQEIGVRLVLIQLAEQLTRLVLVARVTSQRPNA